MPLARSGLFGSISIRQLSRPFSTALQILPLNLSPVSMLTKYTAIAQEFKTQLFHNGEG